MSNAPIATSAEARAQAAQTPQIAREAMLVGPRRVGTVTIHPLSLDIMWLLEACGHPLVKPTRDATPELNPLSIAQLIFCFAAPEEALEAAGEPKMGNETLSPFDQAAFAFVRRMVPLAEVTPLSVAISKLVVETLAAAPQGGGNPPAAAP